MSMEKNETAKFERVGSFFIFLVLGLEVGLPFLISLIICIAMDSITRIDVLLNLTVIFMLMISF